jgi:tetratricopeptide (TPR) repeat protein
MQQTFRALSVAIIAALLAASAHADSATTPAAGDAATAAQAKAVADAKQYSDCMALARSAPDQALKTAQDWQAKGGGIPAGHCDAVALVGLGHYPEAAAMMEKLADAEAKTSKELGAGLFGQAGQARLIAGDNQHALEDQTAALALTPDDAELLTDRAVTQISMAKYWEAIDDLNKAHDLASDRVDVMIFRASAYRFLQSYDLARDDIDRAINLAPSSAEAYLERGVLRSLTKDPSGARADWQKTIVLAPDTPTANQAKADLFQLDQAAKAVAPAAAAAPAPASTVQPALPLTPPPKPQPAPQ